MREEICKLRNEWKRSFPKKASGGVSALAGFDYQFGVFLLNLLQKWTDARRNQGPILTPSIYIESISDIMDLSSEGLLYVTQVKLSPATDYNPIFDEFWETFDLAKRISPLLAPSLRFALNTSTGPSPDIQKRFRSWVARKDKSAIQASELEPYIEAKVLSQPHDRILSILSNELRDTKPVDHLLEWLGRLLDASSKVAFDSQVEIIWQQLVEITNNKDTHRSQIYIWEAADRPPDQFNQGDVLIGQQPTPLHLRQGCFAPRPDVYKDLAEAFTLWWQAPSRKADINLRLPVFWIGGRSGCGKSVALLHLLAHLHAQGTAHILWVGRHANLLPEAIQWASALREQGCEAIIAADDPFAPVTQDDAQIWQNAFASLHHLRSKGSAEGVPILLCCGPTEHANKLEQSFPDDVNLQIESLRLEQQSDYDELRGWYHQRTGNIAPDVGDDNILLVQLFFQWRIGHALSSFTINFKNRIIKADPTRNLYGVFSRVLAANRLYIGYPQQALERNLSAPQLDTLDQLKREHHIADMSMGRDGIWLAHPHLSNAIYESWYPSNSNLRVREEHLASLINDALCFNDKPRERTAPLWAISRSASRCADDEPLVGRLNAESVNRLLPKIYKQRLDDEDTLSLSELPVWIQLRASFQKITFRPDPFDLALDKICSKNVANIGLRLTCHKLLEHSHHMSVSQYDALTSKIARLLTETVNSWSEWPHIATDAFKRTGDKTIEALIVEWLKANATKAVAHRTLFELITHSHQQSHVFHDAAITMLQEADSSMILADIAKQIITSDVSELAVSKACEWAALHCEEWQTGFLLAGMVRKRCSEAVKLALQWAELWHKERSANWVLEALCEQSPCDPRVRDWCIEWLKLDFPQTNTGYLAEKLVKVFPADPVVQEFLQQWLQLTPPSHATWLFVWNAAFRNCPEDNLLKSIGIDALKNVWHGHKLWRFTWRKLWKASSHSHMIEYAKISEELLEIWRAFANKTNKPADWLRLCATYSKVKRHEEAVAAARKALELDNDHIKALRSLAINLSYIDDARAKAESIELWNKFVQKTNEAEDWLGLSISYGKSGQHKDAAKAARKAIELDTENVEALRSLAINLYKLDNKTTNKETIETWETVANRTNKAGDWSLLSSAYGAGERYEAAVAAARKALELDNDHIEALRSLAINLSYIDVTEAKAESIEIWNKVVRKTNEAEDWYMLSAAYGRAIKHTEAVDAAIKALEQDPEHVAALRSLAMNLSKKDIEAQNESIKYWKYLAKKTNEQDDWYKLGVVYGKLEQHEEAIYSILKALECDSHNLQALNALSINLGCLSEEQRSKLMPKIEESIDLNMHDLFSMINAEPGNVIFWKFAVWSYAKNCNYNDVVSVALKILDLHPDIHESVFAAVEELKQPAPESAMTILAQIIEIHDKNSKYWDISGAIKRKLKDPNGSKCDYLKAIEINPKSPHSWYGLGRAYEDLKNLEEAYKAYEEALRLKPHYTKVKGRLEKLVGDERLKMN